MLALLLLLACADTLAPDVEAEQSVGLQTLTTQTLEPLIEGGCRFQVAEHVMFAARPDEEGWQTALQLDDTVIHPMPVGSSADDLPSGGAFEAAGTRVEIAPGANTTDVDGPVQAVLTLVRDDARSLRIPGTWRCSPVPSATTRL